MDDGFTVYFRICSQRCLVSGNDEKQNVELVDELSHKIWKFVFVLQRRCTQSAIF